MKTISVVSRLAWGFFAATSAAIFLGCNHVETAQKQGSEFNVAGSGSGSGSGPGGSVPTTYVSQEQYDRMSPEEREREHAAVGVDATLGFGEKKKPFSRDEFDSTMKKASRDN